MKNEKRIKVAAITVTALLLVAMFAAFQQMTLNERRSDELSQEKLKNERTISEKMKLQQEINDLRSQITAYQGKNAELDKYLKDLEQELSAKEKQLASQKRNAATAQNLKKESEHLKKLQDELNARIAVLTSENTRLAAELSRANTMIASLNDELLNATSDPDNVLMTNNYRLETLKKKNYKLTVRAKKLNKIDVSFDALTYGKDGNYRRVVKNQNGKNLTGQIASTVTPLPGEYYASLEEGTPQKSKKRVELEFSPEEKLKAGIYTILVYHGEEEVGMAQIRLAK